MGKKLVTGNLNEIKKMGDNLVSGPKHQVLDPVKKLKIKPLKAGK
jgi:hypothetical protein